MCYTFRQVRRKKKGSKTTFKAKEVEIEEEGDESESDDQMTRLSKSIREKETQKCHHLQRRRFSMTLGKILSLTVKRLKFCSMSSVRRFRHITAECTKALKKSRGKKAINITKIEDEEDESNSNEKDRIDYNQVISLTINL